MTFVLTPRGPFSLESAASFAEGFPGTDADRPGDAMRFAWALDGDWRTVVATVCQPGKPVRVELEGRVTGDAPPGEAIRVFEHGDAKRCGGLDDESHVFVECAHSRLIESSCTSTTFWRTTSRSSSSPGIGQRPAPPSAIVSMRSVSITVPRRHDSAIAGAPSGWTPITSTGPASEPTA